jgi:hypothetical protein
MIWKSFLTGIVFFAVAMAHAELNIVKDGESEYSIVVAPKPLQITMQAAKDFQTYLEKTTGVKIPILKTGTTGEKPCVVIGDCAAARTAGINAANLPPEGFVIKTIGKNLFIVGRDTAGSGNSDHWKTAPQSGTWYGVARFLEDFLDVRWFFRGNMANTLPNERI